MKKHFSLLSLTLGFLLTGQQLVAQNYSGGTGTSSDPFLIANKADLLYLSMNSGQGSYYFKQIADITFDAADFTSGGDFYNGGKGFKPISGFSGGYDGGLHKIFNMTIYQPSGSYASMFETVSGTIKNLALVNVSISFTDNATYVAALVADASSATISNCYASGNIDVPNGNGVGGLIANASQSQITYCKTEISVSSEQLTAGGLIYTASQSLVAYCSSAGSVTANGLGGAGGLIGFASDNNGSYKISHCYSGSDVTVTNLAGQGGGLVGYSYNSTIEQSFAYGQENGTGDQSQVGGLIGYANSSTITDCYSRGDATASYRGQAGGFIGYENSCTINNTYSTGIPYAYGDFFDIGGMISWNGGMGSGNNNNSFWDTETSGYNSSLEGIGKTTAEMKTESTYTNWDFINETTNGTSDIWKMDAGCLMNDGYPVFNADSLHVDSVLAGSRCGNGTVFLGAGCGFGKLYWYDSPSGGTPLDSGFSYTTPVLNNTTNYWVSANFKGCASSRVEVVATVNHTSQPAADTLQTFCSATTIADLVASGTDIKWYDKATGGNLFSSSHTVLDKDTVYVLQTINGCDSDSSLRVVISINSTLPKTVSQSGNTLTADVAGINYQWLDCDNGYSEINGETSQSFSPSASGDYAVKVSRSGCPTDTSDCLNVTVLGLNHPDALSSISIYPNPGNGFYTIDAKEDITVSVISVTGEIILKRNFSKGTSTLDLSDFTNGLYYVNLQSGSSSNSKLLIKQ